MNSQITPDDVLIALVRLEQKLPELVGEEEWPSLRQTFTTLLDQLRNETDAAVRTSLSLILLDRLGSSKAIAERLYHEVLDVAVFRELTQDINVLSRAMNIDTSAVDASMTEALEVVSFEAEVNEELDGSHRHMILRPGGIGGATHIKLRAVELDFGELSELAAGVVVTVADVVGNPNPLIIASGLLLIIRSATKALTVKISENEASVYWGIIQARDGNNSANEADILEQANNVRQNNGLSPLTIGECKEALNKLRLMNSIEKISSTEGMWRLIESFTIRR